MLKIIRTEMKNILTISLLIAGAAILVTGCADANPYINSIEDPPGFFSGLWHGLILPVDFVISLFDSDVGIYSVNNSGHWYDFGFVLGIMLDIFGFNKMTD